MKLLLWVLLCSLSSAAVQAQPQATGYSLSQSEPLYWPLFKRGQRSEKVRVLQALLNTKGLRVALDGRFGASTEIAVRSFQKKRNLKVDGVVGAQTWEKLVVPLQRGARGPVVRAFQMLLSKNGHRVVQDGVFGAATQRAVRNYQKSEGEGLMVADGRAHKWVWCWLLGGMNSSD